MLVGEQKQDGVAPPLDRPEEEPNQPVSEQPKRRMCVRPALTSLARAWLELLRSGSVGSAAG
jgi:hypothetical protein